MSAPLFVVLLSHPRAFHEPVIVTDRQADALRVFAALADAGPDRHVTLCRYDATHRGAIIRSFDGRWQAASPDPIEMAVAS